MSTRSMIYLKINEQDYGKTLTCDIDKLPNALEQNNYPCSSIRIPKNPLDNTLYLGIYCHFDGYPEGVGKELRAKFKTYDDVLNLILLGDVSSIIDTIVSYKNWRNDPNTAPTKIEGGTKKDCRPNGMIAYSYVFEDNKWFTLS